MRQVTGSLGSVVKGMDKAMQSMNLEQVSLSGLHVKGTKGDFWLMIRLPGWIVDL